MRISWTFVDMSLHFMTLRVQFEYSYLLILGQYWHYWSSFRPESIHATYYVLKETKSHLRDSEMKTKRYNLLSWYYTDTHHFNTCVGVKSWMVFIIAGSKSWLLNHLDRISSVQIFDCKIKILSGNFTHFHSDSKDLPIWLQYSTHLIQTAI